MTDLAAQTRGAEVDVTVVIPARNRAVPLVDALASVAAQSVRPAAVVVVDDASEDGTGTVAAAGGAQVLTNAAPLGSGPSRNRGIESSRTRWIAFLDSDDAWHPGHLAGLVAGAGGRDVLVAAPGIDTAGRIRGNATRRRRALAPPDALRPSPPMLTSGILADRTALIAAGMFRPLRRAQDLDMWIRLLEVGTGTALAHPSFYYDVRPEPPAPTRAGVDRDIVLGLLDDYADRPWMRPSIGAGVHARMAWDDLRLAQRTRDWRDARQQAQLLLGTPRGWAPLAGMLLARRQERALQRTGEAVKFVGEASTTSG